MRLEYNLDNIAGFKVDKGWGYEHIVVTNELYCLKYLVFNKVGARFSYHFHKEKDETWTVLQGSFILRLKNTTTGHDNVSMTLLPGESIRINPMTIHQLVALHANSVILEVSTSDMYDDNFRIEPGDSQSE